MRDTESGSGAGKVGRCFITGVECSLQQKQTLLHEIDDGCLVRASMQARFLNAPSKTTNLEAVCSRHLKFGKPFSVLQTPNIF